MITEPSVGQGRIIDTVREQYGIESARLTFLPAGESSYGYTGEEENGTRHFLKLPRTPGGLDRLDRSLHPRRPATQGRGPRTPGRHAVDRRSGTPGDSSETRRACARRARDTQHTDMIGGNLLVGEGGEVSVLDWDLARFALPEFDFHLFGPEILEPLLAAYERELGPVRLDDDLMALLDYRRNIDDLLDWATRIMGGDWPEAQWEADLEGVAWCLGRSNGPPGPGPSSPGWGDRVTEYGRPSDGSTPPGSGETRTGHRSPPATARNRRAAIRRRWNARLVTAPGDPPGSTPRVVRADVDRPRFRHRIWSARDIQ